MDVETPADKFSRRDVACSGGGGRNALAEGTQGERPGRTRKTAGGRGALLRLPPPLLPPPPVRSPAALEPPVPSRSSKVSRAPRPVCGDLQSAPAGGPRGARGSRSPGRVQHLDSGSGPARGLGRCAAGSWKSRTQPGGHPWLRAGHAAFELKYLPRAHTGAPRSATQRGCP